MTECEESLAILLVANVFLPVDSLSIELLQAVDAERPEFVFFEHSGLQVRISRTKIITDADNGRRMDAGDLEDKAAKVLGIRWQYRF